MEGFMRRSVVILALSGVFAAPAALAAVVVIGQGLGRECYEQTLLDPTPMRNVLALDACDRAVEDYSVSSHDRAAALVNRGDILLRLNRFQEASADSDKAIAIEFGLGVAHLNRGAGLIGLKRYHEALSSLDEAIELGVNRSQLAYFDRGLAKENLGDIRGAYYDYRKAAELDPSFKLATDQLSRFTVIPRQPTNSP
jgi:tetratricopeptide (TPR) repeat protein